MPSLHSLSSCNSLAGFLLLTWSSSLSSPPYFKRQILCSLLKDSCLHALLLQEGLVQNMGCGGVEPKDTDPEHFYHTAVCHYAPVRHGLRSGNKCASMYVLIKQAWTWTQNKITATQQQDWDHAMICIRMFLISSYCACGFIQLFYGCFACTWLEDLCGRAQTCSG